MFLEKIKTDGLAHLSWMIGDSKQAAVIDPRRDIKVYLDLAEKLNVKITHILETHRNEDLITGSNILGEITGASILHGPNTDAPITYAETIRDGREINFSELTITAMHTPGHTNDSMSYIVYDQTQGGPAVAVFTGDTLFVGDVGRADFYPKQKKKMAEKLYESLQEILTIGDQALICPAHGAGSVCGSGMAKREFSSIGHERATNPMLQFKNKKEFVASKINEQHYIPPYFSLMEKLNAEGIEKSPSPIPLEPLDEQQVKKFRSNGSVILDVREPEAFASAHISGAMNLPVSLITAYAGWLIGPHDSILLLASSLSEAEQAQRHLFRIGYDHIVGAYLKNMAVWAATGENFHSIPMISCETVEHRLSDSKDNWKLLDVRKKEELEKTEIEQAIHCYLGHIPEELKNLPKETRYTLLCASGIRATVGASLLTKAGFKHVDILLGSMGAWNNKAA